MHGPIEAAPQPIIERGVTRATTPSFPLDIVRRRQHFYSHPFVPYDFLMGSILDLSSISCQAVRPYKIEGPPRFNHGLISPCFNQVSDDLDSLVLISVSAWSSVGGGKPGGTSWHDCLVITWLGLLVANPKKMQCHDVEVLMLIAFDRKWQLTTMSAAV